MLDVNLSDESKFPYVEIWLNGLKEGVQKTSKFTTTVEAPPNHHPIEYEGPFIDPPNPTPALVLNSTYRSTYELLRTLPWLSHMHNLITDLPTYRFTWNELLQLIPNKSNPLNAPTSLEAAVLQCSRVLDLRESLHIEEIITEMQMDMDQLFLDPPRYHAYQEHLAKVRNLITQTCQSLAYIVEWANNYGINIDPVSVNSWRIARRPRNHPFVTIALYLKPDSWEKFNDYSDFTCDAKDDIIWQDYDEWNYDDEFSDEESSSYASDDSASVLEPEPGIDAPFMIYANCHFPTPYLYL